MGAGAKVIKLAIRFLTGLHGPMQAQGDDVSQLVADALRDIDLETVPLIDIREPKDEETLLILPAEAMKALKRVSKQRQVSLNVLVNTAVAHWLAGRRAIRLS